MSTGEYSDLVYCCTLIKFQSIIIGTVLLCTRIRQHGRYSSIDTVPGRASKLGGVFFTFIFSMFVCSCVQIKHTAKGGSVPVLAQPPTTPRCSGFQRSGQPREGTQYVYPRFTKVGVLQYSWPQQKRRHFPELPKQQQ